MTEKIKVVIDRAKWRTGQNGFNATGKGKTMLLNQEGYMCCLGFCCKAAGVKSEDLLDVLTPERLSSARKIDISNTGLTVPSISSISNKSIPVNSRLAREAIHINDHSCSTPALKEQQILEVFKDSNFEIEFTGEYQAEEENV
jgi:hypothetical protein